MRFQATLWLIILAVLSATGAAAGPIPSVSIQPSSMTAGVGAAFSIDIDISGVVDLYGFQFDLGFDSTVLSGVGINEGAFLATAGSTFFIPGFIDNIGGTIAFTADTFLAAIPGVTGDGTLATVQFSGLTPGLTSVRLANLVLLDSNLNEITATTSDAIVTVTGTPEPTTYCLAALGGIVLVIRRRLWVKR